jgi:CHAT domain-containing protein
VDEQDRYILEHYTFTYLTSGRDLLRVDNRFPGNHPPLVIANPLFGDGRTRVTGKTLAQNKAEQLSVGSRTNFTPLTGTEAEAREIAALLKVVPLTGARATEGAVKGVSGPSILHIATHGYFVPYPEPATAGDEGFDPFRPLSQFRAVEESKSPLLRSGLAFAGANQPANRGGEDGILTALEAAGLDLWGTKLVVLSACETGLGDVQVGEGVYGLRRSFMLAGAESAVMSFWKVDDEVTREMMVQYYKRLLDGEGRSEALRQVQLMVLGDLARSHPYYWASFIHLGNWQGLDIKRAGLQ